VLLIFRFKPKQIGKKFDVQQLIYFAVSPFELCVNIGDLHFAYETINSNEVQKINTSCLTSNETSIPVIIVGLKKTNLFL
jgi:hypothetical protein